MKPLLTRHEDLVHDVAYDFYGQRVASCSSDQHIKVFDKHDESFDLSCSWRAHDAAIVKVTWAGPEYGQILASCSHDGTLKVWEEDLSQSARERERVVASDGPTDRWKLRAKITDAQGPLYDAEFAPAHLGLKLASIGADGVFRVHEAVDPSVPTYWSTVADVALLGTAAAAELQSSFALSWCPSLFFGEHVAVCALERAVVFGRDRLGGYVVAAELPGHKGLIRDVAWAPSVGRGYELVATACKDRNIRIFRISRQQSPSTNQVAADLYSEDQVEQGPLQVELVGSFDSHDGEVWRVSWNLTGTILASAGDDGKVRFWKASYTSEFQCMAVVTAEQRAAD